MVMQRKLDAVEPKKDIYTPTSKDVENGIQRSARKRYKLQFTIRPETTMWLKNAHAYWCPSA